MNIKNTMDNVSYKEMLNKLRTTKKLIFTISYEHKHLNVRYYRPNCPKRNNLWETFTVTSLRNKNFEKQFNFKICIYFFWIFILKRNKLKFKITSFSGAKYTVQSVIQGDFQYDITFQRKTIQALFNQFILIKLCQNNFMYKYIEKDAYITLN